MSQRTLKTCNIFPAWLPLSIWLLAIYIFFRALEIKLVNFVMPNFPKRNFNLDTYLAVSLFLLHCFRDVTWDSCHAGGGFENPSPFTPYSNEWCNSAFLSFLIWSLSHPAADVFLQHSLTFIVDEGWLFICRGWNLYNEVDWSANQYGDHSDLYIYFLIP